MRGFLNQITSRGMFAIISVRLSPCMVNCGQAGALFICMRAALLRQHLFHGLWKLLELVYDVITRFSAAVSSTCWPLTVEMRDLRFFADKMSQLSAILLLAPNR
jgi:hypothetical protein